jgi:16S rRNA (guanine966-N2)-methyltransferase
VSVSKLDFFIAVLDKTALHAKINCVWGPSGGRRSLLRVISGNLRGKRLFSPKGQKLRPTSDRVKEAIFDILQDQLQGQNVLDLFAGTGALGIESLSRGASRAFFVEESPKSLSALRRNIEECRLKERAEVLGRKVLPALKILEGRGEAFGLIFLDPPYDKGEVRRVLEALSSSSILTPCTLVVAEHSLTEEIESIPRLQRIDLRKYGRTRVSFFRPAP